MTWLTTRIPLDGTLQHPNRRSGIYVPEIVATHDGAQWSPYPYCSWRDYNLHPVVTNVHRLSHRSASRRLVDAGAHRTPPEPRTRERFTSKCRSANFHGVQTFGCSEPQNRSLSYGRKLLMHLWRPKWTDVPRCRQTASLVSLCPDSFPAGQRLRTVGVGQKRPWPLPQI